MWCGTVVPRKMRSQPIPQTRNRVVQEAVKGAWLLGLRDTGLVVGGMAVCGHSVILLTQTGMRLLWISPCPATLLRGLVGMKEPGIEALESASPLKRKILTRQQRYRSAGKT